MDLDGDLLPRVAVQERNAVQECINRYGGLVWTLALRWSKTRAEAEDAVQEVFLDLWKSAGQFDGSRSSERNFIAMIARRRLIDRLRRLKRRPSFLELRPELPDPPSDAHRRIESGTELALALELLEQFQPEQKQTIEMSIVQGMSHSEIAESTGLPLGTVKSHIRRGLTLLRKRLQKPVTLQAQGGVA